MERNQIKSASALAGSIRDPACCQDGPAMRPIVLVLAVWSDIKDETLVSYLDGRQNYNHLHDSGTGGAGNR